MSVRFSFYALSLAALCLAGCGGGGGGVSVPTATPLPTATTAPLPVLSAPQPIPEGVQMGKNYWPVGALASGGNGQDVSGLGCSNLSEDFHVHAHLSIFLNGQQLAIPAAIGINHPTFLTKDIWPDGYAIYGDCHYSIHTHDTSGRLHVEAPAPGTFTLGQFFAIWGEPLSYGNIAGITGSPVVVYVNDGTNLRRFTGDLASIELVSQREITIQVGTPLAQIPTYAWDAP